MTNIFSKLLLGVAAATGLQLVGCNDELPAPQGSGEVERGLPCSVTLKIEVPQMGEAAMSRADASVENSIENVALFFYQTPVPWSSDKPLIWYKSFPTALSGPNFKIEISKDDQINLTSGTWKVYALANVGKTQQGTTLEALRDLDHAQFLEYCTNAAPGLEIVATAVLMSGHYHDANGNGDGTVTLSAGANTLTGHISLQRVMAKHTFNFVNGPDVRLANGQTSHVKFVPNSYTVYNVSTSETLMERDIWTTRTGGSTAATGTFPIEGATRKARVDGTQTMWDLSDVIAVQGGNSTTFQFYTRENVQHPKAQPDPLHVDSNPDDDTWEDPWQDYYLREKADVDTRTEEADDVRRTFTYAPDDATYIVVKGHYTGPGYKEGNNPPVAEADGDVEYTIHLGDFSAATGANSNFSVRRNVHYTYNITVNGINNIVVEAKTNTENQPGAEGSLMSPTNNMVTLDAHYETVLLKLPKANLTNYTMAISTPFTSKTVVHGNPEGMTVPADMPREFAQGDDYGWVEFGRPFTGANGTFNVNAPFNTYTNMRKWTDDNTQGQPKLYDLPTLMTQLATAATATSNNEYFVVDHDNVYVTAYVNEYYYEEIPGSTTHEVPQLKMFVNKANRTMSMATRAFISADHHSVYTETPVFQIAQRSIKTGFSLDAPNPLGLETVEETPPAAIGDLNESDDEQWGWNNFYYHINTKGIKKKWSDYIDENRFGHIPTDNGYVMQKITYPTPLNAPDQVITRNRDLDGNGLIDADEVRWYLPSHTQCLAIWFMNNSLPTEAAISKTKEGRADQLTYCTSSSGNARRWWIDEGTAFGGGSSGDEVAVRAVRALGHGFWNRRTTSPSSWNPATRVVTMNGLSAEASRFGYEFINNYVVHERGADADKLPEAFQIAKVRYTGYQQHMTIRDNKGYITENGDGYPRDSIITVAGSKRGLDYSESTEKKSDGTPVDIGYWRIPNEKELALMFQYMGDELPNYCCSRSYYQRPDGNKAKCPYFVQKTTPRFITTADEEHIYQIWLVRDITPAEQDYDSWYDNGEIYQ